MLKANTLNSFFAKQCSLIETGSELPVEYLLTHQCLESVNLDPAKILSVCCAFDASKLVKLVNGTCLCTWSKFVMNPWLNLYLMFPSFHQRQETFQVIGGDVM